MSKVVLYSTIKVKVDINPNNTKTRVQTVPMII